MKAEQNHDREHPIMHLFPNKSHHEGGFPPLTFDSEYCYIKASQEVCKCCNHAENYDAPKLTIPFLKKPQTGKVNLDTKASRRR